MKQRRRPSPGSKTPPTQPRRRDVELVDVTSPFPAVEGVPARPRWRERIRGMAGMTILVGVLGILAAAAISVVLVLLFLALVTTIA